MKKLVSMCLVLLIAITASMSTLAITGCNKAPEKETGAITNGSFEISEFRGNGISLMSVTPMTVAENGDYIEQTIYANVLPESASNKEVDWAVAWADGQSGDVTKKVTVTPVEDGSTIASVKCYQSFTGNIVITVTTREGGYTASCIVTFEGRPTGLSVVGAIAEANDGFYHLGIGTSYDYTVEINNILGEVADKYKTPEISLSAYGEVALCDKIVYRAGGSEWQTETLHTVTLESFVDGLMNISYEEGILKITTTTSIEDYYETTESIDGGAARLHKNQFKEYVTEDAYIIIDIKVPVPGESVSKTMKIKLDETVVTGVNASTSNLYF